DIYEVAAKALIEEELVSESDFPTFATESGFRPPQKHFIDNIVYDGSKPNAYLKKFPIGLKDEVL
ncbi:MAG: nitrate ABC transporter substrate-binding protein, partial [Porticoccaceae bacterium]